MICAGVAAAYICSRSRKEDEKTKKKKKVNIDKKPVIPQFLINKMNDKQPDLTEDDMKEIEKELDKEDV